MATIKKKYQEKKTLVKTGKATSREQKVLKYPRYSSKLKGGILVSLPTPIIPNGTKISEQMAQKQKEILLSRKKNINRLRQQREKVNGISVSI